MADATQIHKYSFSGYDKDLFRPSVTLADLLPQIKVDKWCTFSSATNSNEIAYVLKENTFAFNRIVSSGAIPFIYIVKTTANNVNYLNRIGCEVSVGNNNIRVDYQTRYARASASEISENSLVTDRTLNDLVGMSMSSHATDAYYTTENAAWASDLVSFPAECVTNLPIFLVADDFVWNDETQETKDRIHQFMQHVLTPESLIDDSRILEILNGEAEVVPETTEYYYMTRARQYTVDQYGNITENNEPEIYRGFKIKTQGRASVYKIEGIDDGKLKMGINFDDASICYYSYDGITWQQYPGQPSYLPFDYTFRPHENEVGTFYCSVGTVETNMYKFNSKSDSDEYNDGESDGRKAYNYSDIESGNYTNPTGEDNLGTEFGQVYTRGFFSQQYILDATALQYIANNFFSTGAGSIFDDLKKGLEMFGESIIDAIMGLSFWPLPLNTVFSGIDSGIDGIYFGSYKMTDIPGYKAKIIYPNGYKTLGSIEIKRGFGNWRDFAPYTRLYVSLPYVGVYELDLTRYYGKTVEVRYYFDTRTNGCIACLLAGGHLMDYFNGQMGVTMPITLTDYAGYANSQIATLLGGGGMAAGAAGGIAMGAVGMGKSAAGMAGNAIAGSGMGAAASAAGAGATAAGAAGLIGIGAPVAGAAIGAKTVYGLATNSISKYNITKGASSSMINEYLPQYVEFIFEIQEDCAPETYGQQYGYPSMKSGSVGSFQGFLKCQSVKLDCGVATENEKNAIKTMLLNGIYI